MPSLLVLDLDGSLAVQAGVLSGANASWISAGNWAPRIRLACPFRTFRRFQAWLGPRLTDSDAQVTLYGSGDFHHVTLALLRRIREPFNLLVLDKHPDWMKGVPFLHCGTWLRHALRLPNLIRVFHCGGELDFDNAYRWLAPWADIRTGRIVVFPAFRRYTRGAWAGVRVHPLLVGYPLRDVLLDALEDYHDDLAARPLYVSIDKDVLVAADAAVNWDSGLLCTNDAVTVVETFLAAAGGKLIGADLLGDWSPVKLGHLLSRFFDWLDHPSPRHSLEQATTLNVKANRALLRALGAVRLSEPEA
jgi:hypothetical protein